MALSEVFRSIQLNWHLVRGFTKRPLNLLCKEILDSLLQMIRKKQWSNLKNNATYLCWYKSLFCSSRSSLIKCNSASLILQKISLIFLKIRILDIQSYLLAFSHSYFHPFIHHAWIHNLILHIYLSDYQVGSNTSYNYK